MFKELRILVIEDSHEKYSRLIALLSERLKPVNCHFTLAKNYNEAVGQLKNVFDLVILDLLIPLENGRVSLENSRTLLTMMAAGSLVPPSHVIGLTEHIDAADEERNYYAANMLALELFSWDKEDWADRLAGKISYLIKSKLAFFQYNINNFESDLLVIITRYEREYRPIVGKLKWQSIPTRGNLYFPNNHCLSGRLVINKTIALKANCICVGEMGIAAAAAIASQAIMVFRPRLVVTLGMCCGFASLRSSSPALYGDILIARESASWEEGKYAEVDGGKEHLFRNRAVVRTIDDTISPAVVGCVESAVDTILPLCTKYLQSASVETLRAKYGNVVRALPEMRCGMIVSGSSVVADAKQVDEIITRHPSALGLEMEIYGVYSAVQKSIGKKPAVLAVKGVADFGTGEKHNDLQAYASILSLYTSLGILRKLYSEGHLEPV